MEDFWPFQQPFVQLVEQPSALPFVVLVAPPYQLPYSAY